MMSNQFNPVNERAKHKYRIHVRRALKKDDKTILAALQHIRNFEKFILFAGFEVFNDHVADKYVTGLINSSKSLSYISDNIRTVKEFLKWLERQHGYRSKIDYNHIDYLNISNNQRKTAKAVEYKKAYSFHQIIDTIRQMPDKTDREKRDKAVLSLQALCTLRVAELRTVKMKSLIEEDGQYLIYVSPKNMSVKFAKTRQVYFIPLPDDIVQNVLSWRDCLASLGFKDNDPLFPRVDSRFGHTTLLEQSIKKEAIKSDNTMRAIFKKAFDGAGMAYINPHSFRHTLARLAENQSPAFFNAVRQNLGHSNIDITLNSYGQLSNAEQRRTIGNDEIFIC
jgi:integrase